MEKLPEGRRQKRRPGDEESPQYLVLKHFRNTFQKNANDLNCPKSPIKEIMSWLRGILDEEMLFPYLIVDDTNFGPLCTKALADALLTNYNQYLRHLLFWHSNSHDAGVASVAAFMHRNEFLVSLELLDVKMSAVGCRSLGTALQTNTALRTLVIDHNPIGDEGVRALGKGLKWNGTLTSLSMQFCDVQPPGGTLLANEIIQYSRLKSLEARGNRVGAEGLTAIANALGTNKVLTKLDLGDNGICDAEDACDAMRSQLLNNQTLTHLDLEGNMIGDAGARHLVTLLEASPHMSFMKISDRVSRDILEAVADLVQAHAPKGKRKKKEKK